MPQFKDKSKKNSAPQRGAPREAYTPLSGEFVRVPLPRGNQVIGFLEQRLGANHMMIKCFDGKARNCRVPGRLKRELGGDERGDILLKYSLAQIEWLRKKGFLKAQENL
jgi:translation initiation factor 1A